MVVIVGVFVVRGSRYLSRYLKKQIKTRKKSRKCLLSSFTGRKLSMKKASSSTDGGGKFSRCLSSSADEVPHYKRCHMEQFNLKREIRESGLRWSLENQPEHPLAPLLFLPEKNADWVD